MADYSKQTWVDDTGDGASGTVFTKARMDNIEEGIRVAGKKANLLTSTSDNGLDEEDDRYGVEWTRQSDGSYIASRHVYEFSSNVTALDRTRGVNTAGKAVTHEIGAVHKATISSIIQSFGARLKLIATWGGRREARVVMDTEAGGANAGPNRLLLDDQGTSDFLQKPTFSQPARSRDTNYQPSTTHATLVTVQITPTASTVGVEILIGATSGAVTTHITHLQNDTANGWRSATFMVPVGWYYKLATTNGLAAVLVSEWQL